MNIHFPRKLRVEAWDGRTDTLTEPFIYHRPTGEPIIVPEGFTTDYASIPRFFWRILPPRGDGSGAVYGPAAVIHDYLYQSHAKSKADSDLIFYEAMEALEVAFWRRAVMYRGVYWFGGRAWRSYDDRAIKLNNAHLF